MSESQTKFITVAVIIGVFLTLTAGIVALVINNNRDASRDEYYAAHCGKVSAYHADNGNTYYTCGESK